MTSSFGWKPNRAEGIWRHGAPWLKPLVAVAPWVSVALLLLIFHLIGGTLVSDKGALFDLPDAGLEDWDSAGPVALIVPVQNDTLVFFDDSRYMLGDDASVAALTEHLADSVGKMQRRTMLALADRRISTGDLMRFAALARKSGVSKVLFAEKKQEADE